MGCVLVAFVHPVHFVYHPLHAPGGFCEIVAMGYRLSMNVCHTLIGSACHRLGLRPVVIWIWIIDDAPCLSLSLPLVSLLSPLSGCCLFFCLCEWTKRDRDCTKTQQTVEKEIESI